MLCPLCQKNLKKLHTIKYFLKANNTHITADNNNITDQRFGFRSGRSTSALSDFINQVL